MVKPIPHAYRDWSEARANFFWTRGKGKGGPQKPAQSRSVLEFLWLAHGLLGPLAMAAASQGSGCSQEPCRGRPDTPLYLETLKKCLCQACPQMV